MAIKLYGQPLSAATRRAALILVEKQVPFELVDVNTVALEHKSLEYLKKRPFGLPSAKSPCSTTMASSMRAVRLRATSRKSTPTRESGPALIPTELKAKALFEQVASIEVANFDNLASQAVKEVIGKKRQGLTPDLDRYNAIYAELPAKVDAYEAILSKQTYLAGNEITLADLFHIPFGTALVTITSEVFSKRPNVSRWWNDITSRPSWQSIKDGASSTL